MSLHCVNVAGAPAMLKRQESKVDDNWDYKEETRVFTEDTTQTDLHLAVGKIADAIVGVVAGMASGEALGPYLLKSLKDTVVSAGWGSSDKRDKLVKKLFGNDILLYIEIEKICRSSNKKAMGSTRNTLNLEADTKLLMMRALNKATKEQLRNMKQHQAMDKLKYITESKGWRDKREEKVKSRMNADNAECLLCQRSELCNIL